MVANVCMSQLYPGSAAPYIPVDRRARFVVAPLLMKQITCSRLRLLPLLLTLFTVLAGPPSWAQPKQTAAPAISPDQARAALDTLNDPKKRAALSLILATQAMARPYDAPPGVDPARLAVLRRAFMDTISSPEFRAEADKLGLDVAPVAAAEVEKRLADIYSQPADVVALAKQAVGQ